ncbi:MAG: MopE-related protein, partial [Nitrosarchaeum sp.]|nr:MopE-related protein [Nitrosarchaeum sp.]
MVIFVLSVSFVSAVPMSTSTMTFCKYNSGHTDYPFACNSGLIEGDTASCTPPTACTTDASHVGYIYCYALSNCYINGFTKTGPINTGIYIALCCQPESDSAFCARLGKTCGSVTATDNCGISRTVSSCGACFSGQKCSNGNCAACPAETCNNLDDNCNGVIDESLTTTSGCSQNGICAGSSKTCSAGSWSACSKTPVTETCNNLDDNCNGAVDEGLTTITGCSQIGYCSGAYKTCSAGSFGACSKVPQTETCNNLDD